MRERATKYASFLFKISRNHYKVNCKPFFLNLQSGNIWQTRVYKGFSGGQNVNLIEKQKNLMIISKFFSRNRRQIPPQNTASYKRLLPKFYIFSK